MEGAFVRKWRRIGEILIEMGVVTKEQLDEALTVQEENPTKRIGEILIELGYAKEEDIARALARQYGVMYTDFKDLTYDTSLKENLPQQLFKNFEFVPVDYQEGVLTIVVWDPTNAEMFELIEALTGYTVKFLVSTREAIRKQLYGGGDEEGGALDKVKVEEVLQEVEMEAGEGEGGEEGGERAAIDILKQSANQKPIVMLVNKIILDALKKKASDIHIEPEEKYVRVRYRIDGILFEQAKVSKKAQDAIISRIKIMSNLNIAERMIPQDGAFSIKMRGKKVDFRVSILPAVWGEVIVIRVLAKDNLKLDLRELGFEEDDYKKFLKAIKRPYGMILVSGPTGSGKTTTLYSALNTIASPEVKVITVEDPVEYQFEGIQQVQVHINKNDPSRSLTFASALRSILRQDPDVVMLGEIRDPETAEIAVKAALTGHLVFSTVHANNAVDVIGRMANLGIEPYLAASAYNLLMAQRLVRRICENCKEEIDPPIDLLEFADIPRNLWEGHKFYKGKGCDKCGGTGYKGRAAVHEVLEVDEEIREMIAADASLYEVKKRAVEKGMKTLKMSAFVKVTKGITTMEELIRVTLD